MEQQVAQMMEITQRSAQECQALLEAANGNLDTAVALSFDAAPAPNPPTQTARTPDQATPAPPLSRPRQVNLMEELNSELFTDTAPRVTGPNVVACQLNLLKALFAPIKYIMGLFSALFARLNLLRPLYTALVPDPKRGSVPFSIRLEQEIGTDHIELFDGSYADALTEAKSNLRCMLVILLEWKHQDTPQVLPWLKSEEMKRTVSKHNMVVWAGSLDRPEAYQVALGFNATRYPYVALVGASPRSAQGGGVVMGVLLKGAVLNYKSPADLAHTIDDKAIAHEPNMLALRLDRERNDTDRSIRTQQDQAYEESLARDRARARERAEEAAASERAAAAAVAAREAEVRYTANLAAWKAAKRQQFANPAGVTTRVQIRMPSGRVVARFSETDTLADLYDYVLSHQPETGADAKPATDPATDPTTAYDAGFEPQFDFKLLIPVEQTALARSNTLLKNEPKVWPNGTVIVEPE